MNIALIGMPASGKSYIGRLLADALHLEFVDQDELCSSKHNGESITEIINKIGESAFLDEQYLNLRELCQNKNNLVLATSGSIILGTNGLNLIKSFFTVIYLNPPLNVIEERLIGSNRYLIGMNSNNNPITGEMIRKLFNIRHHLYHANSDYYVDDVIDTDIVTSIVETLSKPPTTLFMVLKILKNL
jgi:shikimate kinase